MPNGSEQISRMVEAQRKKYKVSAKPFRKGPAKNVSANHIGAIQQTLYTALVTSPLVLLLPKSYVSAKNTSLKFVAVCFSSSPLTCLLLIDLLHRQALFGQILLDEESRDVIDQKLWEVIFECALFQTPIYTCLTEAMPTLIAAYTSIPDLKYRDPMRHYPLPANYSMDVDFSGLQLKVCEIKLMCIHLC